VKVTDENGEEDYLNQSGGTDEGDHQQSGRSLMKIGLGFRSGGRGWERHLFDIHVINVYLTSAHCSAWVYDIGSVANIYNSKQELRNRRRLARDEVTMRIDNGSKVDIMAVGTLSLVLPLGLVLNLNKCYYVPTLSMNITSGSCLLQDGYHLNLRIMVVLFI
jgi:hypothetical protein